MNLNRKVAFYTLGCKVNQYESESIKNQLLKKGYEEVDFEKKADIYVVNSCTVTSIADRKTRNMLRRAKKQNPNGKVIVTGCYAETNRKDLLEMEEIDFVIGNKDKNAVATFILEIEQQKDRWKQEESIFQEKEYREYEFATLREMARAYVKIQDGCNEFCSYCKIPFARGKSRSRKAERVLEEIEKLLTEGFQEIILIGINLGDYGKDLAEDICFEDLVERILKKKKLSRLRVGSVYPDRITERFVKLFENSKMMPHLHISLQSCDDTILQRMRRKYGKDVIVSSLENLREIVPDIEYTADIIVGFPGETEEMFRNTYETLKRLSFSHLHVFPYSDREGTIASHMENKIGAEIKKQRTKQLEDLQEQIGQKRREVYIGKTLEMLIEEKKEGYYWGYSSNYLRIKMLATRELLLNSLVQVNIQEAEKGVLIGNEYEKSL